MDINSSFNSTQQALHTADYRLQRNADNIARSSGGTEGSEERNTTVVESQEAQTQAEAEVKVVGASDETRGTLLDTRA